MGRKSFETQYINIHKEEVLIDIFIHIEKLSIKNFKSIKAAELDCKDINIFIRPPNAGKSCFLEIFAVLGGFFYSDVSQLKSVRSKAL